MVRTYVVETADGHDVLEYFGRLADAKQFVKRGHEKNAILIMDSRILAIKGDYFGEGFHQYRLRFDGRCFRKERIR